MFIGLLTSYVETGPVLFLGWFPVKGEGALGVVWTVPDSSLLFWGTLSGSIQNAKYMYMYVRFDASYSPSTARLNITTTWQPWREVDIVWTSTYPSRLKLLFMLQKKVVSIMTFAKYKENSTPLFLSLKILNIYELNIYMYLMALFMYSYFNENLPSYFNNYFKLNEMIIVTILGQPQIYLLTIKGQIMGNFL